MKLKLCVRSFCSLIMGMAVMCALAGNVWGMENNDQGDNLSSGSSKKSRSSQYSISSQQRIKELEEKIALQEKQLQEKDKTIVSLEAKINTLSICIKSNSSSWTDLKDFIVGGAILIGGAITIVYFAPVALAYLGISAKAATAAIAASKGLQVIHSHVAFLATVGKYIITCL